MPFYPTVIRRRGVMDRDASPSVPKTWCPRGQGARFRCPSQAGFGQVWCFVRVRRSDAIGVSRRRRRNAGACVRGCRIGFRRVADASNRGLRAACCRCRFGQLAGGGKWALALNISPQSMPQQAAGITAAASCQQSTVGRICKRWGFLARDDTLIARSSSASVVSQDQKQWFLQSLPDCRFRWVQQR